MASAAEKRIRDKGEALLRQLWPDGRIVHEFDLCGVRLDLACITPDRLILGEVKSENDTLSRLSRQMEFGAAIGGPVFLFCADRWVGKTGEVPWRVVEMVECDDGFDCFVGKDHRYPLSPHRVAASHDAWDSRRLLGLLLKPELIALARALGAKTRHDVPTLTNLAHEGLTGREIRLGVMDALRARRFGWTCDAPL